MTDKKTVEKEFPVQPIIKRLFCADCDVEMKGLVGKASPTSPPVYNYECPKCKLKESSTTNYPIMSFDEVTE